MHGSVRGTSPETDRRQFENILVINLPRRTDRRDAFSIAAAYTELEVKWIGGVNGSTVSERALPGGSVPAGLDERHLGHWRAHMNALSKIVEEDMGSALIVEDDGR